jgi:UDP-GlcNAc:undecaprenyl-phosphate GlcNAc-1-phosphate transferase
MLSKYLPGFVALICCLGVLPLVKRLAHRFNLFDAPGPLKIHQDSIPRLGGIAMFAGLVAGGATVFFHASKLELVPFLVFAVIWLVGLADDIRPLGPIFRFVVHIGAGSALWLAGWRLQWFRQPVLDLLVTCLFVAILINAMNLLDGMDGLAAGTAAMVCFGFLLISASDGNELETSVASSLLGASVAFLTVNAPPARMFMGDSGSTLIGVVLAYLSLNWVRGQADSRNILIPVILLSVPIMDAALAIFRRTRTQRGLFTGDRRHFYDILLQRGWTVEVVLKFSIVVTGLLVFVGWLCVRGILSVLTTFALVEFALATGAFLLGSLHPDLPRVPPSRQENSIGAAVE